MLSPEVWNFQCPKAKTSVEINVPFAVLRDKINSNSFCHSITVVCPDENIFPGTLEDKISKDNDFYKITHCPATELISHEFVNNFVKRGTLACLSINKNCDTENCLAINTNGSLTLHLTANIYQELGLEGSRTSAYFNEIKINLKDERLKSKKYYNKLKKSLGKLNPFDLIIRWKPDNEEICPSSIAKFFFDRKYDINLSPIQIASITSRVKAIPNVFEEDPGDIVEWLGMLALEADLEAEVDYVSTYCPPLSDNAIKAEKVTSLIGRGFFTPDIIVSLLTEINDYIKSRDAKHWIAVSVRSFSDAPWRMEAGAPCNFRLNDSTYTIFTHRGGHILHKITQYRS